MRTLKICCSLCKLPIACFVVFSAVTGYLLAPAFEPVRLAFLGAGTLLLASGAFALNQYQERDIDALMVRTRHRPLPAGVLAPRSALIFSITLLLSGVVCLSVITAVAAALGAFAFLWYNGVYTPLKRRTAFAAAPGALVGAVPPVMGWIAGGGSWTDPKLFAIVMLFLLWQIPHFWLLLIRDRDDYARAGLPVITRVLPSPRFSGIVALWIGATAVASLSLPLYGVVTSPTISFTLPVFALGATVSALSVLSGNASPAAARAAFRSINIFLALVMLLLSIDPLFRRG